ncbi:hypothetical protein GBAR_LOCUS6521 [Geodia barretti]|uniref:Uncharacterized protein n=1 Tax=Geodia barretti TaxID=519541 RepID=A0AA35RG90_GEOBA|nr:hypothetical protein GBAR_LOCUS6521 [Geodia barretti]
MDRSIFLLVLWLVSKAQLGQSQIDVLRLTSAVYEALGPSLEAMQKDIKTIKNDIVIVKNDIASLSHRVDNLTEEVQQQVVPQLARVQSFQTALESSINESRNELSRVNGIISDLGGHLQTHSQQTTSAVAQVDTRLSSLNESMRDDFSGIERGLSGLNSTANMICDKIKKLPVYTCGGTGGWRHAVYLDMTHPNTSCPSGWQLFTENSKTTCGRVSAARLTCDSVFFPVSGGPYSQVCGRIRAYQWGLALAFHYSDVDGVTIVHGSPEQHIWAFAAGTWENYPGNGSNHCPCDDNNLLYKTIPGFIGEDYFCESGYVYPGYRNDTLDFKLHSDDVLWDGESCHSTSTCCSFHDPPYFTKTLNQTTSDDLELRMCLSRSISYNNIAVELVELYVK